METNSRQQLMQLIQEKKPSEIISNPLVADRFIDLYRTIHGIKDVKRAEAFYAAEQFHFLKLVNDSKNLSACTKLSLYGVFMDVAVSGLSFDPSMKHLYIVPYSVNVGTRDNPKWEKRAALQISGGGELLLRTLQGQIKYADNPVVVFEGDEFRYGQKDGKTLVEHMATIPRKSDKIIAAFIKLTRHDDTIDYKVMTMEDIQNLRKFSKDPDSLAWTTGMKGMVEAKVIKHAFKNYPKVRVGEFSKLASETIETEAHQVEAGVPDYGLNAQDNGQQQEHHNDDDFAEDPQAATAAAGITHDDDDF